MKNKDEKIINKFYKSRDKQKLILEILIVISFLLHNYILFAIALLYWMIYLIKGLKWYRKESKFILVFYILLLILLSILFIRQLTGIINIWNFQGKIFFF